MRRFLSCAVMLALPGAAAAVPLELSGSVRVRAEAIGGQIRPGVARDELLLVSRTVLRAELGNGPVTAVAELWDSRAFGLVERSAVTANDVNALEPVQAYVRAELARDLAVTAGRMMLNLGSRRLIAADDFRNTTNGYTGVKVDLGRAGKAEASLVAVLPQQRLPDDFESVRRNEFALDHEGFDLWLAGAVASTAKAAGRTAAEASFIVLREDDRRRATRDRRLQTVALRVSRPAARYATDFDVEGFYQWGRTSLSAAPGAAEADVRAWALHAGVGRSLAGAWRPRVALEYDYASGDDRGPTYRRFDTLFGMRRAEIAPSGLYNLVGRANLSAPGVRLEVTPSPWTDGFVTAKWLWAASATDSFSTSGVRDPSGKSGRFAGRQLDARVRHWIVPKALRLEANMVLLHRGRLLREAPGVAPGRLVSYGALALTGSF